MIVIGVQVPGVVLGKPRLLRRIDSSGDRAEAAREFPVMVPGIRAPAEVVDKEGTWRGVLRGNAHHPFGQVAATAEPLRYADIGIDKLETHIVEVVLVREQRPIPARAGGVG